MTLCRDCFKKSDGTCIAPCPALRARLDAVASTGSIRESEEAETFWTLTPSSAADGVFASGNADQTISYPFLTQRENALLCLRYCKELNARSIARNLKMPAATVSKRLQRARAKIKTHSSVLNSSTD